jgi:hypothetical protein
VAVLLDLRDDRAARDAGVGREEAQDAGRAGCDAESPLRRPPA